jgi:hypothetical protein
MAKEAPSHPLLKNPFAPGDILHGYNPKILPGENSPSAKSQEDSRERLGDIYQLFKNFESRSLSGEDSGDCCCCCIQ